MLDDEDEDFDDLDDHLGELSDDEEKEIELQTEDETEEEEIDDLSLDDDIGESNYARLTIPPGIWFGFQGRSPGNSLIMNVANIAHDPEEVLNRPISDFLYDWN